MLKLAAATAAVLSLLVTMKESSVVDRAELLGKCERIVTPAGDWGEWWACRDGKLSGAADLSARSCQGLGEAAGYEYWRCPASIAQGHGTSAAG